MDCKNADSLQKIHRVQSLSVGDRGFLGLPVDVKMKPSETSQYNSS